MLGWGRRAGLISSKARTLAEFLLKVQRDMNAMGLDDFIGASPAAGRVGERDDFDPEFHFQQANAALPDFTFSVSYQETETPILTAQGFGDFSGVLISGARGELDVALHPVGLEQTIGRDAKALRKELLKRTGFADLSVLISKLGV